MRVVGTPATVSYFCGKCDTEFSTMAEAMKCESLPVKYDKGAQVGDIVRVTGGCGIRERGLVKRVHVIDKHWGHYAWERYYHTVALDVKMIDSYGERMLTFDQYEVI